MGLTGGPNRKIAIEGDRMRVGPRSEVFFHILPPDLVRIWHSRGSKSTPIYRTSEIFHDFAPNLAVFGLKTSVAHTNRAKKRV